MGLSYFALDWVRLVWFTVYQSFACYLMLNTVVRCIGGHRYGLGQRQKDRHGYGLYGCKICGHEYGLHESKT